MEIWQLDFEWLRTQHFVKSAFGHDELPDLQGILLLIGMQELGHVEYQFSKEEKQDLMHIAVCTLLSVEGYYSLVGRDEDGWPHFELQRSIPFENVKEEEVYLKQCIIQYFDHLERGTDPLINSKETHEI